MSDTTFTIEEILDILQEKANEEQAHCEDYCEKNPSTSVRRQRDSRIAQGMIMQIMFAFDEAEDKKKEIGK